MVSLPRAHAIEQLVTHRLTTLTQSERSKTLLDWWTINEDHSAYVELPASVGAILAENDEPSNPDDPVFEPLLRIAIRDSLRGTLNSYLESRLASIGIVARVTGVGEPFQVCPCCQYRSLREQGTYEVCSVCYWEDDGTVALEQVSGPNRTTLRAARKTFAQVGASRLEDLPFVLADGLMRFARADEDSR